MFAADTILRDVRLLAVDQTSQPKDDEQSQVGKTATLELSPAQAELLQQAHAAGTLSLTLRSLGDSTDQTLASIPGWRTGKNPSAFTIIRYGVVRGVDKLAGGR
jgi:pilus assembly protein CpaB